MAKKRQKDERWNVSYTFRDRETSDDIRCVSMNWENLSAEEIISNLNTWLVATGYDQLVVTEKK
jgi:hypothetical protein